MNKEKLIRYIEGKSTESELDEIIVWLEASEENRRYFAELKNLWIISGNQFSGKYASEFEKKRKPVIKYFILATAACIALLLVLDIFVRINGNREESLPQFAQNNKTPAVKEMTVYTEEGVKAKVVLPDSSTVWLNSGTEIKYPERFSGECRRVEISGEALFDVKKDSLRPMIVKTNKNIQIRVLGTRFSVKSYNDDNNSVTSLYSGSIALNYHDSRTNTQKEVILKPSESFIFNDNTEVAEHISKKDIEKDISWTKGELLFNKTDRKSTRLNSSH